MCDTKPTCEHAAVLRGSSFLPCNHTPSSENHQQMSHDALVHILGCRRDAFVLQMKTSFPTFLPSIVSREGFYGNKHTAPGNARAKGTARAIQHCHSCHSNKRAFS